MASSSLNILITATDKASKALADITARTKAMSDQFSKAGKVMMGVGLAIGGITVKAAADFDSAMREVNTMMVLTEGEFAAFKDEVRGVSREMGVSAVKSAEAMYDAISAGIPKENAAEFLKVATKAAIGGITETAIAVDGLTTVLNAFKKPVADAGQVADVMFQAVNLGKVTFEELAGTMNIAAPIAASLGVSFEELMAGVATLTKQGATGSIAMTQMRSAMVALITPNAQMNDLLAKLGYQSGKALLEAKGLSGALGALREAANNDETALAAAMGRVEGLNAVLGLTGANAQTAASDLDAMSTATGSTEKAVEQMDKTLSRQLDNLRSQMTDTAIVLGETLMPHVLSLVDKVSTVAEKFAAWADANPGVVEGIGKVVLALIGAGGFLFAVSKVLKVVAELRNMLIVVLALSGPKGWAVLAAGLGIAAGVLAGVGKLTAGETTAGEVWNEQTQQWEPKVSMATGGVVPGPIGQPVPIIAHGGEVFAGVGGGFGNVTVNVYGSVTSEGDLANRIRESLLKLKGRNVTTGL